MSAILEVRDVHHWFGQRKVLDGIHFKVGGGETLVIMGGSGSGKSTLLRILIGLLQPSQGEVLLFGEDMARASEAQKNNLRKKFGMLFQGAALFNSLSVAENIALPIREHTKLSLDIIQMIAQVKLELVGLSGFGDYKPYEISGGMKKRVGLARAIALDPKIVFYDEPGAGLDPIMASVIDRLILDLTKKLKMASVVVTHEMKSAFRIADRMIVLDRGKIVAGGSPEEIQNSADAFVRQFINGEIDDAQYSRERELS